MKNGPRRHRRQGDGDASEPISANYVSPSAGSIEDLKRQADLDLVKRFLAKRSAGEAPNGREIAAWGRYQTREIVEKGKHYVVAVPKRDVCDWVNRQRNAIDHHARQWGFEELLGATVNIPALLRKHFDFFARYGRRINLSEDDDPMLAAQNSPALERYREEKAKLARLDRLERERELLQRTSVHELMTDCANLLRSCGERLERKAGREAAAIFAEALADMQRKINEYFAESTA